MNCALYRMCMSECNMKLSDFQDVNFLISNRFQILFAPDFLCSWYCYDKWDEL